MLSHAWPIVLVLVVVFGGGIVRTILKALFGGAAEAAREAFAQLPTQFDEPQLGRQIVLGSANVAAALAAVAELQPAQTRATLTEIVRALEAPVPAAAKSKTPKRKEPGLPAVRGAGYARPGEFLAPLPPRKSLHALAALAPSDPLNARRPLAPLSAAHT